MRKEKKKENSIIELQDEVVIEQGKEKIILEKGDRIEVLKESIQDELKREIGIRYQGKHDTYDLSVLLRNGDVMFIASNPHYFDHYSNDDLEVEDIPEPDRSFLHEIENALTMIALSPNVRVYGT